MLPAVRIGCRFNVDAVEYWFYCGGYSVEIVFLDFGFLHQHIKLCLGFMAIIYKNYNGSSRQKSITTLLPIMGYLPFSSSASLSAGSDSFVFSCRICSTVWRGWLSSASCSASTTVIEKTDGQLLQSTLCDKAYRISAWIHPRTTGTSDRAARIYF